MERIWNRVKPGKKPVTTSQDEEPESSNDNKSPNAKESPNTKENKPTIRWDVGIHPKHIPE